MDTFDTFKLNNQLQYAIDDLGFKNPTPIQKSAFPVILSGKDVVGIAQTGTGKTFAYMLPILQDFKFLKQDNPRVLIIVPTRELVLQVVENIESFAKYINIRVLGIYGGVNINTQKQLVSKGSDIVVATPGRLYDLVLARALQLKSIKKLVIDEVDVMLDLGFRFQLNNIFELLPERRQNIMFSATMTEEIEVLIDDFFMSPSKISIAVSGTPLDNISQKCYAVRNFYTKVNLLTHLLKDKNEFSKVLIFVSNKKNADVVAELLENSSHSSISVIHSNKSQNYRIRSIQEFNEGKNRILIATDVMARGLDLDKISHVINFEVPIFPENYMHRIGRTGRAEQEGKSILFFTQNEEKAKEDIEILMDYKIPLVDFPAEVEISTELRPEERPKQVGLNDPKRNLKITTPTGGFHEKKDKNKKINQGGSYRVKIAKKYKKPQRRGDKIQNNKNKK